MIRVLRLDHVALGVPDVEASADFYTERWGLQRFDAAAGRLYFRTLGAGHHALSIEPAEKTSLRHIAFEVASRRDLETAVADAEAVGAVVECQPGDATEPGHRASARLRDPDGNGVELVYDIDTVTDLYTPAILAPRKLGHVVLNTPRVAEMEAFYGRLGLRVSDRTARGMSFLRCNRDHHSLALVNSMRTGVQHIAFDVVQMDDVMRALGSLTREGTPCIWGPGRHGPGNNVFTYYSDPAGIILEYYAEMEQVDEIDGPLEERLWGSDWSGDVWQLAGPPPAGFTR